MPLLQFHNIKKQVLKNLQNYDLEYSVGTFYIYLSIYMLDMSIECPEENKLKGQHVPADSVKLTILDNISQLKDTQRRAKHF